MRIIIDPAKSENVIVTIAIGQEYYDLWERYAFPTWKKYCERYDLGLIVFDTDLIPKSDPLWKKPTWQKMLIGNVLKDQFSSIRNVCYLDTDILINPWAPNVFDFYDQDTIGLVSLRKFLPYPYKGTLRRLAFLRNKYYSNDYPLDSALFISVEDLYNFHNLPVQEDEACMGFFIFNIQNHSEILHSIFVKYDKNIDSITGRGDQIHFNYEIQSLGIVSWLDYRFQAIWVFEMAWKYPFLYHYGRNNIELIRECIESSLFTNYFLHFAGSWHESDMWTVGGILGSPDTQNTLEEFNTYLKIPVTGEPKGQIKPNKI